MPLWNLLGGAAKGFGAEGKYLDEQAAKARIAALDERKAQQEADFRDRSLTAEQTYREHQLKADSNRLEYEKLTHDADQKAADRRLQLQLAAEDRRAAAADRAANARLNPPKFDKNKSWSDVLDYYAKIYAPQGITDPKELTSIVKTLQPTKYKEFIRQNPLEDPQTYTQLYANDNFTGDYGKDLDVWNQHRAKNPKLASIMRPYVDDYFKGLQVVPKADKKPSMISALSPDRFFGSVLSQTAKNLATARDLYPTISNLADPSDALADQVVRSLSRTPNASAPIPPDQLAPARLR